MSEDTKRISEFCESWPGLKREDFVALFTDGAVYRNVLRDGRISAWRDYFDDDEQIRPAFA